MNPARQSPRVTGVNQIVTGSFVGLSLLLGLGGPAYAVRYRGTIETIFSERRNGPPLYPKKSGKVTMEIDNPSAKKGEPIELRWQTDAQKTLDDAPVVTRTAVGDASVDKVGARTLSYIKAGPEFVKETQEKWNLRLKEFGFLPQPGAVLDACEEMTCVFQTNKSVQVKRLKMTTTALAERWSTTTGVLRPFGRGLTSK